MPDPFKALTFQQLNTLRHMLGINTPDDAQPKPYRNYYCANPGDPMLVELVRLGAAEIYSARDGYEWYRCTDAGRAAAMASHKTICRTKSQRVYSKFLDVRDALGDITFRDFLTNPQFAESRRQA